MKLVYAMVTDRIISQLEKGVIPWEKPWSGVRGGAFNCVSKKNYSLLNQMLLSNGGAYATFNQWKKLGGRVRKGEQSEIVVFWKMHQIEEVKEGDTRITKEVPVLKYFNVFHVSQVDGVDLSSVKEVPTAEPIDEAERLLRAYLAKEHITLKSAVSNKAYYLRPKDLICLPDIGQFRNANEYYNTAFHEVTHSTMTEGRCNRVKNLKDKRMLFGDEDYSKEELVAEIGSASILNTLGIETEKSFRNSVAYIQNWLSVLQGDIKLVVLASGQAEKAVHYVLQGFGD